MAQSAFHCSLQWPRVTGTWVSLPVSGSLYRIVPAATSRSTIGTWSTLPVLGEIGRNGL
jgi:hypothetical protein